MSALICGVCGRKEAKRVLLAVGLPFVLCGICVADYRMLNEAEKRAVDVAACSERVAAHKNSRGE